MLFLGMGMLLLVAKCFTVGTTFKFMLICYSAQGLCTCRAALCLQPAPSLTSMLRRCWVGEWRLWLRAGRCSSGLGARQSVQQGRWAARTQLQLPRGHPPSATLMSKMRLWQPGGPRPEMKCWLRQ